MTNRLWGFAPGFRRSSGAFCDGLIDEVAIYDDALSAKKIRNMAANGGKSGK